MADANIYQTRHDRLACLGQSQPATVLPALSKSQGPADLSLLSRLERSPLPSFQQSSSFHSTAQSRVASVATGDIWDVSGENRFPSRTWEVRPASSFEGPEDWFEPYDSQCGSVKRSGEQRTALAQHTLEGDTKSCTSISQCKVSNGDADIAPIHSRSTDLAARVGDNNDQNDWILVDDAGNGRTGLEGQDMHANSMRESKPSLSPVRTETTRDSDNTNEGTMDDQAASEEAQSPKQQALLQGTQMQGFEITHTPPRSTPKPTATHWEEKSPHNDVVDLKAEIEEKPKIIQTPRVKQVLEDQKPNGAFAEQKARNWELLMDPPDSPLEPYYDDESEFPFGQSTSRHGLEQTTSRDPTIVRPSSALSRPRPVPPNFLSRSRKSLNYFNDSDTALNDRLRRNPPPAYIPMIPYDSDPNSDVGTSERWPYEELAAVERDSAALQAAIRGIKLPSSTSSPSDVMHFDSATDPEPIGKTPPIRATATSEKHASGAEPIEHRSQLLDGSGADGPEIFNFYTISEDRTGDREAVYRKLLSAQRKQCGDLQILVPRHDNAITGTPIEAAKTMVMSPPLSDHDSSDGDTDSDGDLVPKPPLIRKANGELVRPALRPPARRGRRSSTSFPTHTRAVRFAAEDLVPVEKSTAKNYPTTITITHNYDDFAPSRPGSSWVTEKREEETDAAYIDNLNLRKREPEKSGELDLSALAGKTSSSIPASTESTLVDFPSRTYSDLSTLQQSEPSLPSSSYQELIDKYCFFSSEQGKST